MPLRSAAHVPNSGRAARGPRGARLMARSCSAGLIAPVSQREPRKAREGSSADASGTDGERPLHPGGATRAGRTTRTSALRSRARPDARSCGLPQFVDQLTNIARHEPSGALVPAVCEVATRLNVIGIRPAQQCRPRNRGSDPPTGRPASRRGRRRPLFAQHESAHRQ